MEGSGPLLVRADILRKVPIRRNDNTIGYELHVLEVKAKSWDSSASIPTGEQHQDVDASILGKTRSQFVQRMFPIFEMSLFRSMYLNKHLVQPRNQTVSIASRQG